MVRNICIWHLCVDPASVGPTAAGRVPSLPLLRLLCSLERL